MFDTTLQISECNLNARSERNRGQYSLCENAKKYGSKLPLCNPDIYCLSWQGKDAKTIGSTLFDHPFMFLNSYIFCKQ